MRTRAISVDRPSRLLRGTGAALRAGARGITVRDESTDAHPVTDILFVGAVVTDEVDGVAVVTIGGEGGSPPPGGGDNDITHYSAITVIAASGSAQTLDLSDGKFFYIVLTANCALTFTNPPASGQLHQYLIALVQGGSGGYTVTWPASVSWADTDGTSTTTAPALFTAVGAQDDVLLSTQDGGGTWGATLLSTLVGGGENAGHYELLMDGGSPPAPLEDGSGTDWLYVWVP